MVSSEYIEEKRLLIVRVSGEYVLSEGADIIKEYIEIIKIKNCKKCLIDYRAANYMMDSIGIIQRSEIMYSQKLPPDVKLAALFNEISEDIIFIEAALSNRGWKTKAFDDEIKALHWLDR